MSIHHLCRKYTLFISEMQVLGANICRLGASLRSFSTICYTNVATSSLTIVGSFSGKVYCFAIIYAVFGHGSVIGTEGGDAVGKEGVVLGLEEGGADAYALLVAAHGVERIDRDAVVHQLARQLEVGHAGILHREVEAVGQGFAHVVVVDQVEAIVGQHLLHESGTSAILAHLGDEVEAAVACCLHHGGHGVLYRMAAAAGQGVDDAGVDEAAELTYAELLLEGRVDAAVEAVADTTYTDALTGIREGLRARDGHDVIVGVMGHRCLIGRLEGMRQVLAEVHGEVGQILEDDGVVARCQLSDAAQLVVVEAYPRRVVGVGVDDARNVASGQDLVELGNELVATVVVDVEADVPEPDDVALGGLYREARVDEEDGVLVGTSQMEGGEDGKRALHRTDGGDASLRPEVDADVGLDEARGGLLQAVDAGIGRIDGCTAFVEGLLLGLDAYLRGLQSGDAHLEVDKRLSGLLLEDTGQHGDVAYRGTTEVAQAHLLDGLGDGCIV